MKKLSLKKYVVLLLTVLTLSAVFSATAMAATLAAPKKLKVSGTVKKHTLSWKKVSGAEGYLIYEWNDESVPQS